VRGWLRRFRVVAGALTQRLMSVAADADRSVRAPPAGAPLVVALTAVAVTAAAVGGLSNEKELGISETTLGDNRAATRRSLTKPDASAWPIPDRVGRLLDPDHVDVPWVGDISDIPTGQGRLDLAAVVDLASRRLLGSLHEPHPGCPAGHRRPQDRRRRPPAPLHGPGGLLLRPRHAIHQPGLPRRLRASRGGPIDEPDRLVYGQRRGRAPFGHPQRRARHPRARPDRRQAHTSIFAWVHRYNARRLHSSLGSLPRPNTKPTMA
jgi:transposase InsO family protein